MSGLRIAACVYLAPRKLGSMEQWLVELCAEARRRGHAIHVFVHLPVHPTIAARFSELGVTWSTIADLTASLWRGSRRLRSEFDVVYLNLAAPRGRGALAAYLAWPRPVLFFEGTSGRAPWYPAPTAIGRMLDPLTFIRVRALAGASRYVVERDRSRFRLSKQRCSVIYNGIDVTRFTPGERKIEPPGIVAVANLIREKGIDRLIQACGAISDLPWRLRIVGDGPEEPALRQLAAKSGLAERIEFAGLRDDVDDYLRRSEIYAHPAVWEEAFGLTITEAMAAECATVASAVGGIPELVEDGVSGMLVPPGDAGALATALRRLLLEPTLRRRLGKAARERVSEHFTLTGSAHGQLDWIERWAGHDAQRSSVS